MASRYGKSWLVANGGWIIVFLALSLQYCSTPDEEGGERRNFVRGIDLGTVMEPPDEPTYQSVEHVWQAPDVAPHKITFAHGHRARSRLYSRHARLDSMFASLPITSWCRVEPWGCVYTEVSRASAGDLERLIQRMEYAIDKQDWTTRHTVNWLLTFVQEIPYRIPENLAFQVLPPPLVVSEDWGDCDSKSLLLLHLLARAGIDAHIFVSRIHQHAMVGIHIPTSGKTIRYRGRNYAWAETTGYAPLGWINPKMLKPNDWKPVEVDLYSAR